MSFPPPATAYGSLWIDRRNNCCVILSAGLHGKCICRMIEKSPQNKNKITQTKTDLVRETVYLMPCNERCKLLCEVDSNWVAFSPALSSPQHTKKKSAHCSWWLKLWACWSACKATGICKLNSRLAMAATKHLSNSAWHLKWLWLERWGKKSRGEEREGALQFKQSLPYWLHRTSRREENIQISLEKGGPLKKNQKPFCLSEGVIVEQFDFYTAH